MDDWPYSQSMFTEEHAALYVQRNQGRVQRLHHLGFNWPSENVPIWTGLQRYHVLLYDWGKTCSLNQH